MLILSNDDVNRLIMMPEAIQALRISNREVAALRHGHKYRLNCARMNHYLPWDPNALQDRHTVLGDGVGNYPRALYNLKKAAAFTRSLGVAKQFRPREAQHRPIAAILRHKALHAGPRLDQCTIDREVLVGEQLANLRQIQYAGKELGCDVAVEQPIPSSCRTRSHPTSVVRRKPDKLSEQIVVELLHQLPFRTHPRH